MTAASGLRVTACARRDIRKVSDWWDKNRPLDPGAVKQALGEAFDLLRFQPGIGARAANAAGVRRLHLRRLHHFLYYRVSAGVVEVLSL